MNTGDLIVVPASTFCLSAFDDRVYTLALPIRPASIRDAMWRSEAFVDALVSDGRVNENTRAFVVGMGPVGKTIVAKLLRAGATIWCCNIPPADADGAASDCQRRVVCPTTFDWPCQHAGERQYPLQGENGALSWSQGRSKAVHNKILQAFDSVLAEAGHSGRVEIFDPGRWRDVVVTSRDLQVVVDELEPTEEAFLFRVVKSNMFPVDLAIVSTGLAPQMFQLQNGQFASHGFWSMNDALLRDARQSAGERIAILGAGDGGLGDFVRLLTNRRNPWSILEILNVPPVMREEVGIVTRRMWQSYQRGSAETDHHDLRLLQHDVLQIVNRYWENDADFRSRVFSLMLSDDDRPHVQLVVGCDHFGCSYTANIVLAFVFARALVTKGPVANGHLLPFRIGVQGVGATGLGRHECASSAADCATSMHKLSFGFARCKGSLAATTSGSLTSGDLWMDLATQDTDDMECHRILLRTGIRPFESDLPRAIQDSIKDRIQGLGGDNIRNVPPFYSRA